MAWARFGYTGRPSGEERRTMNTVEPDHQDYVGRTEHALGRVEIMPLEAKAALLDHSFEEISPDGRVPPLWHWLLLQSHVRSGQIVEDGHLKR
jgi:3-methylfumaryl-CoA hydratase